MSEKRLSIILFLTLVLIWGSAFILIKRGLVAFDSLQVASIRMISALIVLLPFAIHKIKQIKKREWPFIALSGLCGSLIPAILFGAGMNHNITSSTAGILSALTPSFTFLISVTFFKLKFNIKQPIGLIIGFLGACLLLVSKSNDGFVFNSYGWLIVIATSMYAINLTLVKYKLKEADPLSISAFSLIFTLPVTLWILFSSDFISVLEQHPKAYSSLGYSFLLGASATGIALHLFNKLLKIANPVFISSVTYAIPLVALFWGFLDGEQISLMMISACSIIIFSIYLIRQNGSSTT